MAPSTTTSTTIMTSPTTNNRLTPPRTKERRTPPSTKQNKAKDKPNSPDLCSDTLSRHRHRRIPDRQKKKKRSPERARNLNKSHQRGTYSPIHPTCQIEMPPNPFGRKRPKDRRMLGIWKKGPKLPSLYSGLFLPYPCSPHVGTGHHHGITAELHHNTLATINDTFSITPYTSSLSV
ncbi:hypothetical protein L873DRAFT_533955 [Choiromyces venosus 120613-1]|uniref:Uncharacterized protein n=1 Tax=Choiromyces venosus 120613-1 TaxID=1336337 RepID=A0A3N4K8Q0_9PEZI|nr:hypothetical protein L873DRAFT_533955 [Choiromyces venosus 120613-1]